MTPVARLVSTLAVLITASVIVYGQAQTRSATPTETATVTGKITHKGKPAIGVVVMLRRSDGANPYENQPRATTDQLGSYRITEIPPGSYQLMVTAPAFVVDSSSNLRNRLIVLSAGETVDNLNYSIVRGGVVTGKVTDSEGRPVIEQRVNLFRAEMFNRQPGPPGQPPRVLPPAASGSTDDRGIYRIFGVAAGQYKVAVGRGEDTFVGSMSVGRTSFQQVFHPDVTDQAKATVIDVSEGSEATGIDITLGPPLQTFTAAGRTVDGEKLTPMPNIRFGVQRVRGERAEFMNSLNTSNSQGDFVIEGLLPGKYRVFIMPEPNNKMRADALDFEIVDNDVTGLTIKLSQGAGISGIVVLEPEDQRARAKLKQLQISAHVPVLGGATGMGQSGSSEVNPDGTFSISGLPSGTASLWVYNRSGAGNDQAWIVSRIERDGVIQPKGIEIKESEQLSGIRVVVSYGSATVRGVISFTNGEPSNGSVSLRIMKPGDPNFALRPIQADARGHFLAEGIPPGVYELVVVYAGPGSKPRQTRQQVTLQDGVTTDVVVNMDLTPQP